MKINKEYIQKLKETYEEDIFIKYLNLVLCDSNSKSYDEIFDKYYDLEEIISEDFIEKYLEKDLNSRNIFGDYYNDYITKNSNILKIFSNEIYIYKIEFSMNIMQKFLFNQIHEHLLKEYKTFLNFFSKGSLGGFFEVLIIFAFIKNNIKIFDISIDKITQIDSIVPINFSIKYDSSLRKKLKFKKVEIGENKKKKIILDKNTFIFQRIFNAKYYDAAILIKTNITNTYDLLLLQITIKKDSNKRFNKYEHEIIISYVKINLENIFNIKIRNSYFFYVLSEKNGEIEDKDTKKNCDKIGIKYISYNFEEQKFNVNFKLEDGFITNNYLNHNIVSLYNLKEIKKNDNAIKNLDFTNFEEISDEIFNILKLVVKNKENNYIIE